MNKILLIEDDVSLIKMYERVFVLEKFELISAVDGDEGLTKAIELHPELILLDIMMPKMDGMELLLKLKSQDETKDIPVIVLTNLAGSKEAQSALYMGAVEYLIKSDYEPKQIVDIVKTAIFKNKQRVNSIINS